MAILADGILTAQIAIGPRKVENCNRQPLALIYTIFKNSQRTDTYGLILSHSIMVATAMLHG